MWYEKTSPRPNSFPVPWYEFGFEQLNTQIWNCITCTYPCQIQPLYHVDQVWAWKSFVLGCPPHLPPPSWQHWHVLAGAVPHNWISRMGQNREQNKQHKTISKFSSMGSRDVRGGAARFSTGWDITRPTKRQLKQRKHKHKYKYKTMRKTWHGFWTCWHFRHLMTWIIVTWPFRATLGGIQNYCKV